DAFHSDSFDTNSSNPLTRHHFGTVPACMVVIPNSLMNTRPRTKLALLLIYVVVLLMSLLVRSQTPTGSPAKQASADLPHTSDSPDLLRETQLSIAGNGHSGLVWWFPFECWVHSAEERGESPEKAA